MGRSGSALGLNYDEGLKHGIGPGSIFRAWDMIGIEILGIDPSLVTGFKILLESDLWSSLDLVFFSFLSQF